MRILPRDDARRWSEKVQKIIKASLSPETSSGQKKELDEDYQRRIFEKIHGKNPKNSK